MKKILKSIIILYILSLVFLNNVSAQEYHSIEQIISCSDSLLDLKKYLSIQSLLTSYNSPIKNESHAFILSCKENSLDCYLLPSIAGLESGFGKYIVPASNNPFGWGKGYIVFSSWSDSINTVGSSLKKYYIDQGYEETSDISRKYAPDSQTWHIHVDYFRNKLYNEELKIQNYLSIIDKI